MFNKENNRYNILNLETKEAIDDFLNKNDGKTLLNKFNKENETEINVFELKNNIKYGFSSLKYCSVVLMLLSFMSKELSEEEQEELNSIKNQEEQEQTENKEQLSSCDNRR